jgi:hypothetical protein
MFFERKDPAGSSTVRNPEKNYEQNSKQNHTRFKQTHKCKKSQTQATMTQSFKENIHDARIGRVVSFKKHVASRSACIGADCTDRNTGNIPVQVHIRKHWQARKKDAINMYRYWY